MDPRHQKAAKRLARELWEPGTRVRHGVLKAIATELGVTIRTLQNWMRNPEFIAQVRAHLDTFDDAFDRGLRLSLQGDGDRVAPSAAILVWYGKTRFGRDEKLPQQAQRHRHNLELLDARAQAGFPDDGGVPVTYRITVTEAPMPGDPAEREREDELH